jgi:hypothetical protein
MEQINVTLPALKKFLHERTRTLDKTGQVSLFQYKVGSYPVIRQSPVGHISDHTRYLECPDFLDLVITGLDRATGYIDIGNLVTRFERVS